MSDFRLLRHYPESYCHTALMAISKAIFELPPDAHWLRLYDHAAVTTRYEHFPRSESAQFHSPRISAAVRSLDRKCYRCGFRLRPVSLYGCRKPDVCGTA